MENHASQRGFLSRRIVIAAQLYLNAYCSLDNYDMKKNGEYRLLQRVGPLVSRTMFDVGANIGEWTQAALDCIPSARIHAFELSPVTASIIKSRFASEQNVVVNACGLSSVSQEVEVLHVDANNSLSGLNDGNSKHKGSKIPGRVITGRDYLRDRDIDYIGLLKIDTEGHDYEVIAGFAECLRQCQVIQFEHNEFSWARGSFLEHFQGLMPHFRIGRLTEGGVLWDRSLISNERIRAGNLIACHKERTDLVAALERFQ